MSLYKSSKSSPLSILRIKLGKEEVVIDIHKELRILEEGLEDNLKQQPLSYGFLSMVYQEATKTLKEYKLEVEGFYCELYNKHKNAVVGGKYLTKEGVEAKIKLTPKYKLMCKKLIQLETNKGRLEDLKRSLEQRKDIMQTLSANRRKEL